MRRSIVLVESVVLAATLAGCAPTMPSGPSKQTWIARGDSTLEADPGRALANYLHAGNAVSSAKLRDARIRWLRHELQKRRASPTANDPAADLAFVSAVRSEAKSHEIEVDLAADLDGAEATFAAAWWKHELATLSTRASTPFEQYVYLLGLRKLVPATAPEVRAAADKELDTRLGMLFANLEEKRAKAFDQPAAQALYETLIALLQKGDPNRVGREKIARNARASVTMTTDVCEELSGLSRAVLAGDGAHRVTIHVRGTCSADESQRSYTETETWTTTKTEEYWDTEYEKQCRTSSNYEAPTCIRRTYEHGANGACAEYRNNSSTSETCTDVPKRVRKTRDIDENHSGKYDVAERTLTATVEGTYVFTIDGVEKRVPFRFPKTVVEKNFTARESSGSFSRRTPRSLLTSLADDVAADINSRMRAVESDLIAAHVATARTRLGAGDMGGAEAEIATALFAGGGALDPAFEPLAARAGMPLSTYADALRTGTLSLERTETLSVATVSLPDADKDLVVEEETADRVRTKIQHDRDAREGAAYELDRPLSSIGIGLDQWAGLDTTSHGLTLMWARHRGGGLLGGFWFRDFGFTLDLNLGRFAAGLEAPVRFGGGFRHPLISIAGYVVGGASRRGADDAMDPGLPLSLDAGYGVQLVLGATRDRRVELTAERLLRPLVDVPEMGMGAVVQQRLRYELRYIKRDFIGDSWGGGRLWCTFEQTTNDDLLFVSASTNMRTCAAVVHVMYD